MKPQWEAEAEAVAAAAEAEPLAQILSFGPLMYQ